MAFLIDDILMLPLTGPARLILKLSEVAEAALTDAEVLQEELLELQMRFEQGELKKEEYERREAKIMAQLDDIMKYKETR